MQEEVDFVLEHTEERMRAAIAHLEKELLHIRAGKASPAMLDGGSLTPLSKIANISTPDARTVAIQPWEKSVIPAIEKAILNANLGFNPSNNGEIIRINVPVLTEERRKDLVKVLGAKVEEGRISIRNIREDAWKEIQEMEKEGQISEDEKFRAKDKLQAVVDEYNKKIEEIREKKEKEIMTV